MNQATELFEARSRETDERLATFRDALSHLLGNDARSEAGERTTVYVTGSGGRGEMSEASDLDLFLVTETEKPSALYAPILQSAIIRATRECGIVDPSADGVFLEMHTANDFVSLLGSQEDDARNKFTARMLFCKSWAPRIHSIAT